MPPLALGQHALQQREPPRSTACHATAQAARCASWPPCTPAPVAAVPHRHNRGFGALLQPAAEGADAGLQGRAGCQQAGWAGQGGGRQASLTHSEPGRQTEQHVRPHRAAPARAPVSSATAERPSQAGRLAGRRRTLTCCLVSWLSKRFCSAQLGLPALPAYHHSSGSTPNGSASSGNRLHSTLAGCPMSPHVTTCAAAGGEAAARGMVFADAAGMLCMEMLAKLPVGPATPSGKHPNR